MQETNNSVSGSQEDYLEAIFALTRERSVARSKDIAARLNVSRSSVSGALHALQKRGLVEHESYGYVTLTPEGEQVAGCVARRHGAWKAFLTGTLGVEEEEADATACRLEHGVSKQVTDRLLEFVAANDKNGTPMREPGGSGGDA
ncbi:metal-dependent transcriptional regulator [Kiritimatiella glycovorans]|uniref:Transcriptional regulator MntR n=1 Tax=Kiritimatiella glycovorans TaxID=1307763 RepID=A0A0G3EEH7_9BACT|nr:metal-dependent transcriptional regulator [Kiritimatiella glycovorans]AKJ64846.1 putative transport regulator [Kiritimatiella glycovorans]